jgi:hypothetical protein
MAIVVLFEFPGLTQAQYDQALSRLTGGKPYNSFADMPAAKGVLMHAAFPTPAGFRVVDVWESEAAFQAFGAVLAPILKEIGFPDAPPQIFPAYKFVRS